MTQDLAAFQRKIDGVIREFDGVEGRKRLQRIGVATKGDVDEAVSRDIGSDLAMRGWRRGRPIKVAGRFDITSDHEFEVKPAKGAAGPMRVLEQGRNQGQIGGFAGPGVNRKTGARNFTKTGKVAKMRTRKGSRWNGQTQGKNTWSDAVSLMEQRVPGRVDKEVKKALRRHLTGG